MRSFLRVLRPSSSPTLSGAPFSLLCKSPWSIEDLNDDLAQDDVDGEGSERDNEEESGPLSHKEGHEVDGDGGTNGDVTIANANALGQRDQRAALMQMAADLRHVSICLVLSLGSRPANIYQTPAS
jgi:hypothetical protein